MTEIRKQRCWSVGLLIVVVGLVAAAALVQVRLIRGLSFDGENSLTEGEPLAALWRIRQGETLYCDYRRPPHVLTQYMPLSYVVPGLVAQSLNCDWWQTMWVGRAYVYGCWVLVGVAIGVLVRRHAGAWPATVGMLLWWIGLVASEWANSFRPDAPALLFSLAALGWYDHKKGLLGAVAAGVLVSVALLHKQSALAAPVVLLWNQLRQRRWQEAIAFAAAVTVAVGITVAVTQWVTGGLFVTNVLTSVVMPGNWRWPIWLAASVLLMGGAVFGGVACAWGTGAARLAPRWWRDYFVVAFVVAFVTSFKFGSWTNYYLEAVAAGCILSALLVEQGLRVGYSRPLAVWLVITAAYSLDVLRTRWTEPDRAQSALAETVTQMGRGDDPVLVEDSYLAVRGGIQPYLVNAANFQRLRDAGKFDDSDVVRKLQDREFAAVVTMYPLQARTKARPFPVRWLMVGDEGYALNESEEVSPGHGIFIYRRKSAPAVTGGLDS